MSARGHFKGRDVFPRLTRSQARLIIAQALKLGDNLTERKAWDGVAKTLREALEVARKADLDRRVKCSGGCVRGYPSAQAALIHVDPCPRARLG